MGKIWFGGPIYTMENEGDAAEAVFTEGSMIKAVGTYERIYHDYHDSIDHEVNLKGRTMLPGFVDSHMHIIGHGEKLLRLDLSQMQSPEEVKKALHNRTSQLSEGEWLVGEGWNENQWHNPVILHKTELDDIAPDNPMILTRVCRHALIANTKAMNLADIHEKTPDPEGGIIDRDEKGMPSGYFLDTAQDLIKQMMPDVSQAYLQQVIKVAIDDLLSKGLVGGHTEDLNYYGGFMKTFNAFTNAIDGSDRVFKAHLLVHHEVMTDMTAANLRYGDGTDYVELGAVKIFTDGALGGRTAWLTEAYADDPGNNGVAIHNTTRLEEIVRNARKFDMPVAVHAIGDQAINEIAAVIQKYPLKSSARDRIIHGQILNRHSLEMLAHLPVVVDIQPSFVASDFPWALKRLGEHRSRLAYAWKTMLDKGVSCAGSSDAPIEDVNPLKGIQDAALRQSSYDNKVYQPDEILSRFEAVRLYTAGSAYAINQETYRGVIAEEFSADFTILEEDIFQTDSDKIKDIEVAMTVIDGDIVYEKNPYL